MEAEGSSQELRDLGGEPAALHWEGKHRCLMRVRMSFRYSLLCGVHCELLSPLSLKPSGKALRSVCILWS